MTATQDVRRQALASVIKVRWEHLYGSKIKMVRASKVARGTFDRILKADPMTRESYLQIESALGLKRDAITRFLAGEVDHLEELEVDESILRVDEIDSSAQALRTWFSSEGPETPAEQLRVISRLQAQLAEEILGKTLPDA